MAEACTAYCERSFLTLRESHKRYPRLTLGYSKIVVHHNAATAFQILLYNAVRQHTTIGTTPAVAAGIAERAWSVEDVVSVTKAYFKKKEDEAFELAFQAAYNCQNQS